MSKLTLESYDRDFGLITYVAASVSVVIALFAWFGFTEYKQVVRPLRPPKSRQEQLIDQVGAESSKLAELGAALQAQKSELDRYVRVELVDTDVERGFIDFRASG